LGPTTFATISSASQRRRRSPRVARGPTVCIDYLSSPGHRSRACARHPAQSWRSHPRGIDLRLLGAVITSSASRSSSKARPPAQSSSATSRNLRRRYRRVV
jgi:hypothetical protein